MVGATKLVYFGGISPTCGLCRRIGRVTPKRVTAPFGRGSSTTGSAGGCANTSAPYKRPAARIGIVKARMLMAQLRESSERSAHRIMMMPACKQKTAGTTYLQSPPRIGYNRSMSVLIILQGPEAGRHFTLAQERTTLGRNTDCAIP